MKKENKKPEEKVSMIKGKAFKQLPRITEFSFQLAPYKEIETGYVIYFLNKLYKKRRTAGMIMNKKELRNLKRFMNRRKIR